jgi:Fe2+ or Zn2+ uptake regulation protein
MKDMDSLEDKVGRLRSKGVVLTLQRLAVLEVLAKDVHATAEDIYRALAKRYPTISRATIYSSLDALKHSGEIQELTIRRDTNSYDFDPTNHHHLLCRECGRIYDVDIRCPVAEKERVKGHRVDEVQAYFYGICQTCIQKKNELNKPRSRERRVK